MMNTTIPKNNLKLECFLKFLSFLYFICGYKKEGYTTKNPPTIVIYPTIF